MKIIQVVAAIIKKEDKIFATKRGYGEFKGLWEIPGGKVEKGEKNEDALKREIQEELDTEISVNSFVKTIDYDYSNFHLTMHCYLCSVISGKLTLLEHLDAKWLRKEELESIEWLPADYLLLDNFRKVLDEN